MFTWGEYNERLIKRGELLLDLDFMEGMEEELRMMNQRKRGRRYRYGEGLFKFPGYLYAFVRNYRILKGYAEHLAGL